ncbi:hypothetical protein OS493_039309 [Desmophyllum pertusum]|uniref:Uncharacterized protein n=1 Tax=Desmophyllum pertusum TaxID=174260 RepID=A0A9X0CZY2_9CNID|nr:hypothetical protein OS493_039309 [Desmophyllum pertusum]
METYQHLSSYEPFYGARIFVVLSSGKRKLLKLNFLPESGKVMSKKAEFISPQGERITSVTVMLGCFGYEGYVTFTDLAVKPIYDSKLMKNQSIEPKKLLEPCQAPSKRPRVKTGDFLTEILYSASSPTDSDAITLVTQLTFNRINILKRNLRFWNGPLSVVIYVLLEDANNVDLKKNHILDYNATRNSTDEKVAFVVPAFDGARNANSRDLPETKEALVKMVKRKKKLAPFRQIESPLSHSSTNYSKWYHSNESYEVSGYQDKYEPYLILRYKFIVLPNVWIVHRYHTLSPLSFAHLTDPDSRFANRLQRFEFISDLYNKHKIGHCKDARVGS